MIFFDTETCGLHGPTVLIQWARDDGPVELHSVFNLPAYETLELIEEFCDEPDGVVGFNLSFDWFHICQTYTVLSLFPDKEMIPNDHRDLYAELEPKARDGLCLKPHKALDLMLHARKGPYQNTMNRADIRIKKVPTAIAWAVADRLDQDIPLKDIYFARKQDPTKRWQVYDIMDDLGDVHPDFKDIVLKFQPSSALKALAQDALKIEDDSILLFTDVDVPKAAIPKEIGYAPLALAVGTPSDWKGAWPDVIHHHIIHWSYNELARKYAKDDVIYTRGLYEHFGRPDTDDDDSVLACMVGAVRWKGFKIDHDGITALKNKALQQMDSLSFNFNSVKVVRTYIEQVLSDEEKAVIQGSTKAVILEEISTWTKAEVCGACEGMGCDKCNNEGLIEGDNPHPAALRAREILSARHAKKEVEIYDKLLRAGRFHASFNVIGTLSSRMSGGDGLNAQGIKKTKDVRSCFPLAADDLQLCGGDFSGFEVVLADAVYGDPKLRNDLLSGKKIHALFGQHVFKDMTYDEIMATSGTDDDKYSKSKQAVFAMLYGGEGFTLKERLGVDIETADEAYQSFITTYERVGEERKKVFNMFCSMRQPGGIGSKVEWHEPEDYIESIFGFRRYFTLENSICRTLFNLAESPPKEWSQYKVKVVRRDREQTAVGATRSALFACAFGMQAANMRAAANHVIQSSGATITKMLQRRIWDLQPPGVNNWRVQPMNVHDEIMCPTNHMFVQKVRQVVEGLIADLQPKVPLIEIEWSDRLKSWADK